MLNTQGIHASSSAVFDSRGVYLFAVVDADRVPGNLFENLRYRTIDVVEHGRFGGIVTAFDISQNGITTQLKERHAEVLQGLMGRVAFVPMKTGTTFGGADGVRKFMAENDSALAREYDRVAGAAEFDVRVSWQAEQPLALMAKRHDELGELYERSREATSKEARNLAFRIGRVFDEAVARERRRHREQLDESLASICREVEVRDCRGDSELARLRCLVGLDEREMFERRVYEAAERFDDQTLIELTGAVPPDSFTADIFGNW